MATNRNIMMPNRSPDQRTAILLAMLKEAAINAKPMKYIQNILHGMYGGTSSTMPCPVKRCNAPKTPSGMAKHKLLKAAILSRPRAWVISFFEANTPIKKSAMPVKHMATAVREIAKNITRKVESIDF